MKLADDGGLIIWHYRVFVINPVTWKKEQVAKTHSLWRARKIQRDQIKRGRNATIEKYPLYI